MTQDFLKEDISLFKSGVMSFEAVSLIKEKKKVKIITWLWFHPTLKLLKNISPHSAICHAMFNQGRESNLCEFRDLSL